MESAKSETKFPSEEEIGSARQNPKEAVRGDLRASLPGLGEVKKDIVLGDIPLDSRLIPDDCQELLHMFRPVGDMNLEEFGVVGVCEGSLGDEDEIKLPFCRENK